MYFKEKHEEDSPIQEVAQESQNDSVVISNNQTLFGINDLSSDMISLLKKVAMIYGKTIEFQKALSKKNNIAKGAITQNDIQSMIKIVSQDINNYINTVNITANKLKKSYMELDNKVNIILTSNDMCKEYTGSFNKVFFYKTLNIHMDKHLQNSIDSGIFLIKLINIEKKSNAFMKNVTKTMIKKIHSELRHLDIIANVSDDIFAVLISDASHENFIWMLKNIIQKIKLDNVGQLVSAGMVGQFDNANTLMKTLIENLSKAKSTNDDFIFV